MLQTLEKWRQVAPWDSLANQNRILGEFHASERDSVVKKMRFGKHLRTLEVVLGHTLSLLHPTPTNTQLNTIISLPRH